MTITATLAPVRTYQIDKTHSDATFQVRHLLTKVRGRFTDFTGAVEFDEWHPAQSSVTFTIQTASVDTGTPDRDTHLRSADFFAVDQYPTLTFVSASITPRGGDEFDVQGDLTIHGVSTRVTLPVSFLGKAKDPWGGERLAFEGELTINRKDYGLTWNAALETGGLLVGDEVKISVSVQAVGQ